MSLFFILFFAFNIIFFQSQLIILLIYYFLCDVDLSKLQQKRGPTRNLAHLKKKQAKQDVPLLVSEHSGRLVGEGAQLYISEASSVVRCHGKWKAEKWGKLPKAEKDKMLKMIEVSTIYKILYYFILFAYFLIFYCYLSL